MNDIEKRQLEKVYSNINYDQQKIKEKFDREKEKPENERDTKYLGILNEHYCSNKENLILIKEILENNEKK